MTEASFAMPGPHPASTPDPLVGRLIDGRYRVQGVLGQGGMGLVYEAQHEVLGTRLALKLLRSEVWGDEEALARLKREAQAASAIGHENIVDVRDFGRLRDGSTYVVMELVEGDDLLKALRASGPMPWRRARAIARQIADALGAAHAAGIVHRDLKPENVILTARRGEPDFVKLVDFGIALVQGGAKITQAGRVVGTPEYMSPEQCAGVGVDHRVDVYALGVLLYEMTTGSLPFSSPDLLELVRKHIQEAPRPPRELAPDLPPAFEALILRCLAKRPARRFQSMAEVAEALDALETGDVAPPPPEDLRGSEPPIARDPTRSGSRLASRPDGTTSVPAEVAPARRSPMLVLGLVAAVGGALAGFAVVASSWGDEPAVEVAAEPPAHAPIADAPSAEPDAPAAPGSDAPGSDAPGPDAPGSDAPGPDALDPGAPAEVQLVIDTIPPGAAVLEGEAFLGNAPFQMVRPEGDERVTLTLRAEGYEDSTVSIGALSQPALRVELRPAPASRRGRASESTGAASGGHGPATGGSEDPGRRQWLDPWAR